MFYSGEFNLKECEDISLNIPKRNDPLQKEGHCLFFQ